MQSVVGSPRAEDLPALGVLHRYRWYAELFLLAHRSMTFGTLKNAGWPLTSPVSGALPSASSRGSEGTVLSSRMAEPLPATPAMGATSFVSTSFSISM